jgi:hypothetical protein
MTLVVACPQCDRKYSLREEFAGKQVRCARCSAVFSALAAADPLPELSNLEPNYFAELPPVAHSHPGGAYRPNGIWVAGGFAPPTFAAGRTDTYIRLKGAAAIGGGLLLVAITYLTHVYLGNIFLMLVASIPLFLIIGLTGLIAPDIMRAVGFWEKPPRMPQGASAWGLLAVSLILGLLLVILVFTVGGYKPG